MADDELRVIGFFLPAKCSVQHVGDFGVETQSMALCVAQISDYSTDPAANRGQHIRAPGPTSTAKRPRRGYGPAPSTIVQVVEAENGWSVLAIIPPADPEEAAAPVSPTIASIRPPPEP